MAILVYKTLKFHNLSHFTTLKFIIVILNTLYCGLWCGLWWSVVICGGLWYLDSPLQKRILQNLGNYHAELETTTQDERGMNNLRVNAQIFFLCWNVYLGSFYHCIVKRYQIPFNLTDMG